MMIKYDQQFQNGVKLWRQGDNKGGISEFQKLIQRYPHRYSLHTNLGCLLMKDGQTQLAINNFSKAIQIDSFHHAAYYNRFMCRYQQNKLAQSLLDLEKSLSCLYASKAKKQSNKLYAKRSLQLCNNNLQSLILNAQFYTQYADAQNAYSQIQKIIDPLNENLKLKVKCQFYASKILFYEKNNDQNQIQQLKRMYLQTKKNIQDRAIYQNFKYQLKNNSQSNLSDFQILNRIQKLVQQTKIAQTAITKQEKTDNYDQEKQNQHEKQQKIIKSRAGEYQNVEQRQYIQKSQLSNGQGQNTSSVPSLDQSKFLNQQIKKLEMQIQQEGGKLQVTKIEDKQQKLIDQSAEQRILQEQIEKAMQQIGNEEEIKEETKPMKEQFHQPPRPNQNTKRGSLTASKKSNRSFPPLPQKLTRTKSVIIFNENMTSEQKLIEQAIGQKQRETQAWLKHYMKFKLQLFSIKLFLPSEKYSSKNFYCICDYAGLHAKTKPIHYDQKWDFSFQQEIVFARYNIKIDVYQKGGFFSADSLFAKGSIHLLQKNATKCILQSKDGKQKLGILYFKLDYE